MSEISRRSLSAREVDPSGSGPVFVLAGRKGLWRQHRLCIHLLGRFEHREQDAQRLRERATDHRGYPPSEGTIAMASRQLHHRSDGRLGGRWRSTRACWSSRAPSVMKWARGLEQEATSEDTERIYACGYVGSVPRSRPALPMELAVGVGVGVTTILVGALLTARFEQSIEADQKACQAVLPLVDHTRDLLGEVTDRDADPSERESARVSLLSLSEEVRALALFDRAQLFADALEDMAAPPSAGSPAASEDPVAFARLQTRTADLLDYCS